MENIWSEIRNDFEDEGIVTIDAWINPDDNEEGKVIANVHPDGRVEYIDARARKDKYAQEMIIEAVQEKLYSLVVDRIKKDIESCDITAVIELLSFTPNENLIEYLSEESWEHFKSKL
jgi:hypothetical protein